MLALEKYRWWFVLFISPMLIAAYFYGNNWIFLASAVMSLVAGMIGLLKYYFGKAGHPLSLFKIESDSLIYNDGYHQHSVDLKSIHYFILQEGGLFPIIDERETEAFYGAYNKKYDEELFKWLSKELPDKKIVKQSIKQKH